MTYSGLILRILVTCVASLLTASAARADLIALTFAGGTLTRLGPPPGTVGWRFSVSAPIMVTQLGFWDASPATPLETNHAVGVWTDAGVLVRSDTVLAGSALTDGFRFTDTPDFVLAPGTYRIGGFIAATAPNHTFYISTANGPPLETITALGITYHEPKINQGGAVLTFPDFIALDGGLFGPTFRFARVPEPFTLALVGLGLAGLAASRRRKH